MDISLCRNKACTKRSTCLRYRGVPSAQQAYAHFEQDKNGKCDFYWNTQGWNDSMIVSLKDADSRH